MPESKCSSEPIGVLGIVSIVGLNWIRFSCSDDDRVFFRRLQNHLEYWTTYWLVSKYIIHAMLIFLVLLVLNAWDDQ